MFRQPKKPIEIFPQVHELGWTMRLGGSKPEEKKLSLMSQLMGLSYGVHPTDDFMNFMEKLLKENKTEEAEGYLKDFHATMVRAAAGVKPGVTDQASQNNYEQAIMNAVKEAANDWYKKVQLNP